MTQLGKSINFFTNQCFLVIKEGYKIEGRKRYHRTWNAFQGHGMCTASSLGFLDINDTRDIAAFLIVMLSVTLAVFHKSLTKLIHQEKKSTNILKEQINSTNGFHFFMFAIGLFRTQAFVKFLHPLLRNGSKKEERIVTFSSKINFCLL